MYSWYFHRLSFKYCWRNVRKMWNRKGLLMYVFNLNLFDLENDTVLNRYYGRIKWGIAKRFPLQFVLDFSTSIYFLVLSCLPDNTTAHLPMWMTEQVVGQKQELGSVKKVYISGRYKRRHWARRIKSKVDIPKLTIEIDCTF